MGAIVGAFLYESMIGLHWPLDYNTPQISIGHNHQTETDFNLSQLSHKNGQANAHVNHGYNGAMRVYVS